MISGNVIVKIDDSLKDAQKDIDELERKWGAEELGKGYGVLISRNELLKRISNAEDNFKADYAECIYISENPDLDGVLSGVFNIREMVQQAKAVIEADESVEE